MAKNVGGAARKRELTLHEIEVIQNAAFEAGVEAGREAEQALARLKSPVTCPHCLALAEIEGLKRRLAVQDGARRRWS